ncbi:MAG: methyltransferase domain-containing protein [Candidatus Aminicenantes bacterium]|nr:methyltransferase domain-containing protein [Candidatus Aminicenantes bacterium]
MKKTTSDFFIRTECPVCLSSHIKQVKKGNIPYYDFDPDQIKITDKEYGKIWDLSQCEDCTHVFANPCPSPDYIQSLYSQIKDPSYEEEAEGREKNFLPILWNLIEILSGKGEIFDVGAATGIFLNLARKYGWTPAGVETSNWAVDTAAEKYHLRINKGAFESVELKKNHYQVVTMIDFIEHIPHPQKAVHKARRILRQDGVLCLVTPNQKSLAAKISGSKWWHFRPAHIHYFNKSSLQTLLKDSGFQIKKIRNYCWTFSAHYLISRFESLSFLLKNHFLSSFFKKIPIKLALGDSIEIYAQKKE